MDFVIEVESMPVKGETILGKSFSLVPGGKGANQAYAIGKLGTNVSMLGAVGNDEYGAKLLKNLNTVGVQTENIQVLNDVNTGSAFINVDKSGENSIVVISGANEKLTKEMINNNINLIDEADIIILQLEIPLNIVTYVSKIAHQKGKLVILDPAPAVPNLSDELLSNIDIIKPNETEIQILSGKQINTTNDIIEAGKILLDKGVKTVIVTLGEKGSLLIEKDKIKSFTSPKVNAIDTTAAGDSFTAALATSLLEGNNIEEAIKFSHIVSAIAVTKKGAQTSIPNRDEINSFLQQRGEL